MTFWKRQNQGDRNRSVASRDMREGLDKKGHKETSCGDGLAW